MEQSQRRAVAIDIRFINISMPVLMSLLLFFSSCGGTRAHYKKLPPKEKAPQTAPKEPSLPEERATIENISKRNASMNLIEEGKNYLDAGNKLQAERLFRNAVKVDSTNGVAYYYLAFINHENGNDDVALGLLDKAQSLLRDRAWSKMAQDLRDEVSKEE